MHRLAVQVRQEEDQECASLCKGIGRGEFPQGQPLPLQSVLTLKASHDHAQMWRPDGDARLDRMIVAGTIGLADEHNRELLERMSNPLNNFRGITEIMPVRDNQQNS